MARAVKVAAPKPVSRERVCVQCGAGYGESGPLPGACDWHLLADGSMVMTCGAYCRRVLGYKERKLRA